MNARWLEQLGDSDRATRERVQARFWQELTSAEPREGVLAALAAAPTARSGLRRKLQRLLTDAAVLNEAVFFQLVTDLTWRTGAAQALARAVCQETIGLLEPALVATRLVRALELPMVNTASLSELLELIQQAAQRPSIELRQTLAPLQKQLHPLPMIAFDTSDSSLSHALRTTIQRVQEATDALKDLPLPAAPHAQAENLPVPAEAQALPEASEAGTPNLWERLRQRFGTKEGA